MIINDKNTYVDVTFFHIRLPTWEQLTKYDVYHFPSKRDFHRCTKRNITQSFG